MASQSSAVNNLHYGTARALTQNAYIESFNGKFRDECLNEHWFTTLAHARAVIAAWRQDYNEQRPHSALNYLAPSEFAAKHRETADTPATFQELV
ncbi:integrase core domain-containing protein [Burkholderia cenocepacia]|uniref:integrase core domain-containing protein n=1 Tax=Burkholderia cenocepacia TaxID=95486 RepID=UPI0022EA71A2|nr:transposase [Burkholderia cenocepacia]MDA3672145.1 transposase [Burkholderia cenocepacia]MDA3681500.1 transposase [Burkholderia cenocepacia]MDA3689113.1 transposase [Burkholderia cenocepacia]MDA3696454.1 transposase [Burkholderia cenocepacia]MDA3703895.1 transposase [Burkholderia cenocepacia]